MPKRAAGKKARKVSSYPPSVPVAAQTQTDSAPNSSDDSQPPVATNPAPSADEYSPSLDEAAESDKTESPGLLAQEWADGYRQVFRLPNGAVLVARDEIEAGAYANKGAELVDEFIDK